MKNLSYFFSLVAVVFIFTGCYDRDVLEYKEGVTLPAVTDLKFSLSGNNAVDLNWNIPAGIPDDFARPLSVYMQVYNGTTLEYQIQLRDEPTEWSYTLKEPDKKYRIVVKMWGRLKEKPYGQSDEIYSLGQTVSVN